MAVLVLLVFTALLAPVTLAVEPVFDLPHRGCYFTNWAQYRAGVASYKATDVDANLCTYISVAFGSIVNNQLSTLEWNDATTYTTLVALKATRPNLKIFLSVGGWTLTSQLVTMSATASARKAFIASVVTNLRSWKLDGLDVDWEFPLAADRTTYSTLLTELRTAFNNEVTAPGTQRLALSAALHVVSDGGFDGAVINNTLDIANVMTYDMAGAWDVTHTGHQAPLLNGPLGVASDLNVASIMQAFAASGISKSKLIVGLPLYGRGWMLAGAAHDLGAPATAALTASSYTLESGSWPYYEICQRIISDKATIVFNTNIQAAYAYTGTWWIGYDDVQTITAKTKWAQANGYGGVYVWDTAQDDFGNLCGLGKNPLLTAIKNAQSGVAGTSTTTQAPPTQSTIKVTSATSKPSTGTTKATSATTKTTTKATSGSGGSSVCGTTLCLQHGPGLAALGTCSSTYCNCDSAGNGYLGSCGAVLVFDKDKNYCNYRSEVDEC